jgi:hypothetical protein
MALWLVIQAIQIEILGKLDQAFWLLSLTRIIHSQSRRRNIKAKANEGRGVARFGPVPYFFQYVYK